MRFIISVKWIDIPYFFQCFIMKRMKRSFNKPYNYDENLHRFTKKSCMVDLYYENQILEGICISWITSNHRFIYLDKFFSVNFKPGIGKQMLNHFIEKNDNNNRSIIWRCDKDVSAFYLKHDKVIKYFDYNINHKDVVYLGVKMNQNQNQHRWEYEDIYDLKIKSCFQ